MDLQSPFLKELEARGLMHQCTNLEGLDALSSAQGSIALYTGYDATAPSLHVGNLMSLMIMRIAQRHGHKPLVIMGGATTRLGDPTWKDTERPLLDESVIRQNIETIQKVFKTYLNFETGPNRAILLNNDDWLGQIKYLDLLREVGRFLSVNRMLAFDSVRMRLEREQPLTFLEFNYMVLQGYDFLHLNKKFGCVLQCGGSDQWGNIVNGIDLIRRIHQKEAFGLTCPLLTTASGKKMGKTEKGAVWLNAENLSPYDYWQFWRNVEDADVIKLMKIYTDLPLDQIEGYQTCVGAQLNDLKMLLADEATSMAHDRSVLEGIHRTVQNLFQTKEFSMGGVPSFLESSLPIIRISEGDLESGLSILTLLVQTGLCTSNTEARRAIRGNGCSMNGQKIVDEALRVKKIHFDQEGLMRLSVGKKNHALVQLESITS